MNVYASLLDQEKKQPTTDTTLPGNNKYSEILGQEREQQMAAVKPVLDMASKITPQHAADAQGLSKKLGLPTDFVERNFDALQKREQVMNVQRAMTFSPILARQMRDPQFAQLAYQDIENLSALEKALGVVKNSGRAGLSGLYEASAGTIGTVRAGVETLSPLLNWAEGTILPENPLNRVAAGLREYQQSIDRTAKHYMPDTTGIVDSGFYAGMASLSRNLMFMPLALFGPSGMKAALTGMVLPVFGGEYGKAKDAGRDQLTSLGYGASQAAVEWAFERLPLGKLVGDLKVGAPFYRLLINQLATEIPTEQATTILQDFNEWMVINPEKTAAQYLAERPGAAAQTLIATIVGVGGQTTVMKGVDMAMRRVGMNDERAADAERQAALLKQITEISQASKVLEASPETFEQFLQAAMEDGPVNSIFIDGQILMQSGLAEQVAQISPELADQVQVATQTGGMIQIPVSEYMTRIAPTEAGNQLLDHIKISPEAFTQAEARDYMLNQAQALQAEIDTAIAQDADVQAFRDSQERVKQSVLTSLNTLGRFTGPVNEVYATLHAARAATRAAQLGITPEQMFDRQLVKFAAQGVGGGFVLDQGEIEQTGQLDEATGLPLNADGTVTLYHHTSAENAEQIRRSGRLQSAGEPDLYFTTTSETNTGYGDTAIAVRIDPSRLLIDDEFPDGRQDFRVQTKRADKSRPVSFLPDGDAVLNQSGMTKTLDDIRQQWREMGIDATISERDGLITLSKIVVPDTSRGQGQGTAAMQALVGYADQTGQHIALSPSADFGGNKSRLVAFYKRFGFVENKGKNKAFSTSETMYRLAPGRLLYQSGQRQATNFTQAREAAKAFQGKDLVNEKTGIVAVVSRNSLDKMLSNKAVGKSETPALHSLVVANLDTLFQGAILGWSKPDRAGDSNIVAIHRFFASIDTAWGPRIVKMTVKETAQADRQNALYTVEAVELNEKSPAASWVGEIADSDGIDPRTIRSARDVFSLAESIQQGNSQLNQGANAPRGSYNPQQNIIALLANADLSTFLHESGHYFFESDIALASDLVKESKAFGYDGLKEGEKQILDDVSSLLRWHGIQGNIEDQLAAWNNMDFEEKRSYHERTAESFEKYLMEGKAPSIELQSYFQTFRSWLLNVYKSIKDFLAKNHEAGQLNDEVRAVFDRMLATNEQIEVAQTARSMMPLIKTPEDAQRLGLTTDEYEAYQKITLDADQDAAHDLEVKALGDLKWLRNLRNKTISRLQKEAAGLRKDRRIEARREVMSQPIYRAWQFLTNRMTQEDELPRRRKSDPDVLDPRQDSLFVAIAKLGGLDRDQARSEWGLDPKDRPESRVFGKPVLRVEGGKSLDEMRLLLIQEGYVSPETTAAEWDPREFEDKFFAELAGDTQYSSIYEDEVDPTAADRGQLAGRLDLTTLRMMGLNEDQINVLKARKMTAKEGLAADLIAEQFGFSSGDEMVRMLLSVPPPREAIEALTDQKMLQEHSELATPEAIEREADRAIHNEARARMITTEVNALNRKTGKRKILMSAARQFAQELIARLKVRDIKPSIYTNAAARAGRAAESAMMKGDLDQAANEKRNQLIQTVAAKAAFDAREEVQRIVRYLNKFDREGTRKAIDPEYMAQIDKMLERFDLRQGQSLAAIDKRTSLADWIAEQEDQGIVPDIPDYLRQEANRTHFKNLTVEEVRGLRDTIQQIEHLGRLKNRLLNDRDKRTLDAIVQEVTESIEANRPEVVDNERRNTLQSRVTQGFRWLMAAHRQLHSLAREMDGYKDGGPFWNVFIRSMNEAGEMEASMRADASRKLHELVKPILAGDKMGGKGKFYPTLNRSLNRGEKLAIALNWGNAGNRQRLLDGRGWTEAQILPILETLTEQELQFVQGVWDFFESYRPLIAAKEMRVAGKEPDWVEPAPFVVTATNGMPVEMRGGYYPIKYDPMQSGEADRQNDAEVAKQMLNSAMTAATTRRSYTKSRVDAVKGRPVLLSFEGIYQGANEVIHDLSWHEWLIDANKLLRRLDKPIRDHYGAQTVKTFQKTIEDIATGDRQAANAFEKVLQHLRNGSTVVGLAWNVSTSLLQFTGIFNSNVRVGSKWVASGVREFYGTPSHMIQKVEEAQAKSEFLRNRMRTMNREINDIQNKLDAGKSDLRMAIESSFFVMIQKSQAMVDYPTWYGAYLKALDDPSLTNPDGTIDDAKAVAMADQAVIAAQSGGQVKDLAQIQRGHPALKLFTNFISYFISTLQIVIERTNQTNFRKPGEVLWLALDYIQLMVLPAILGMIIRDFMKGDTPDDEEELMERLLQEQISFLMGFSPLTREATAAVQAFAGVDQGFGYSGPAGVRFFNELYKLGRQVGQGELDMPLFKAANNTAGMLFHYPAGQVNRMVEGTMALIDGKTSNPLAPLVGIPYNR